VGNAGGGYFTFAKEMDDPKGSQSDGNGDLNIVGSEISKAKRRPPEKVYASREDDANFVDNV
jgi:hypothetical protein